MEVIKKRLEDLQRSSRNSKRLSILLCLVFSAVCLFGWKPAAASGQESRTVRLHSYLATFKRQR